MDPRRLESFDLERDREESIGSGPSHESPSRSEGPREPDRDLVRPELPARRSSDLLFLRPKRLRSSFPPSFSSSSSRSKSSRLFERLGESVRLFDRLFLLLLPLLLLLLLLLLLPFPPSSSCAGGAVWTLRRLLELFAESCDRLDRTEWTECRLRDDEFILPPPLPDLLPPPGMFLGRAGGGGVRSGPLEDPPAVGLSDELPGDRAEDDAPDMDPYDPRR